MALIKCPDCGQMVSDRAKACIHCGCPLSEPDYTVKIKTPKFQEAIYKVTHTFTDDSTGRVLATAYQNQVVSIKLDKPTRIRCHLRGWKDSFLDYTPHENARYNMVIMPGWVQTISFQEVDHIDTD